MVNSAHSGEGGGGVHALPLSTITSKLVVHALAERAGTLLLFLLYTLWSHLGQPCFIGRQLKTSTELQNLIEGFTCTVHTVYILDKLYLVYMQVFCLKRIQLSPIVADKMKKKEKVLL
jgi:hypothetical protein